MIPWKILSDPNAGPFKNNEVLTAATWVNNYIITNHQFYLARVIMNILPILPVFTPIFTLLIVVVQKFTAKYQNIYLGSYKIHNLPRILLLLGV